MLGVTMRSTGNVLREKGGTEPARWPDLQSGGTAPSRFSECSEASDLEFQPRLCQPCKQAQVAKQLSLRFNFKCSNHKNLEGCENEQINNTPTSLKWKMNVLAF